MTTCTRKKNETRHPIVLENKGEKIFGVLHLPEVNGARVPGVIVCHGLAGEKTGRHRLYVDLASGLSQRGIATLRFDYRGCGDSEGEFINITPQDHYSDAALCLEYLKEHSSIDPTRIGAFGRSFGGPVALKTAGLDGAVKSLALWCPMFNGAQWLEQWHLVQTDAVDEAVKRQMMQINSQQGSFEFFDQFFNIDVTGDLLKLQNTPLLHIHGEVDTRVNLVHAKEYETCRKSAKAVSDFIRYPNSDHDFSHIDERMSALNKTLDWFTKTL